MAKGKHSTALFEVIRKDRLPSSARERSSVATPATPSSPPLTEIPAATDAPPRQELLIRLTYPSAIAAGLVLATLLGGAFLAGQKSTRNIRPAISVNTGDELRQQSPQPEVVNVSRSFERTADAPEVSGAAGGSRVTSTEAAASAVRGRINGANYIIIQSYPEQEHRMAEDAVRFLRENGIEATIEKDLPRWGLAGWYTVLGTTGFEKISSQQCDAYTRKIREISDRYAKKGSFKAFDPKPYRWGKAGTN